MHAATETIGLMASLTSFVIGLPHAARVWRYRNDPAELRGIAMGSQVIGLAGTFLWSAYAILTSQVWVGAPHVVNGPITVATIVVLLRARGLGETEPVAELSMADLDRLLEPEAAGADAPEPRRELAAA